MFYFSKHLGLVYRTQINSSPGLNTNLKCILVQEYVYSVFSPSMQVVAGRPRTRVESSDTDSSVEISQACPDDAGTYTILVRNRRGLAQHTVTLSVIGEYPGACSWSLKFQPFNKLGSYSLGTKWKKTYLNREGLADIQLFPLCFSFLLQNILLQCTLMNTTLPHPNWQLLLIDCITTT